MLNGLDCTAAQLRTTASGSQCRLVHLLIHLLIHLPFTSARCRLWIVELIGCAEAADAAHRIPALLDCQKSAVRSATPAAAIDGAPGIPIVRHPVSGSGRRRCRPKRRQHDEARTHCRPPWLERNTEHHMQFGARVPDVWQKCVSRAVSAERVFASAPPAADCRTDWVRR